MGVPKRSKKSQKQKQDVCEHKLQIVKKIKQQKIQSCLICNKVIARW